MLRTSAVIGVVLGRLEARLGLDLLGRLIADCGLRLELVR